MSQEATRGPSFPFALERVEVPGTDRRQTSSKLDEAKLDEGFEKEARECAFGAPGFDCEDWEGVLHGKKWEPEEQDGVWSEGSMERGDGRGRRECAVWE